MGRARRTSSTRGRGRSCWRGSPGSRPARVSGRRVPIAADGRPLGPARPRARGRHRRRPVAAARAAARLARRRLRCSGRCSSGTLQVLADEARPAEAWFGVPIESLILPVGGRGRLSRRDPARAVRAVARAGARHHLADRGADARARGAASTGDDGADRRRPDGAAGRPILLVAFLGVHRRRGDGPRRARPAPGGGRCREGRPAGPRRGRRARRGAARLSGRRRCG